MYTDCLQPRGTPGQGTVVQGVRHGSDKGLDALVNLHTRSAHTPQGVEFLNALIQLHTRVEEFSEEFLVRVH